MGEPALKPAVIIGKLEGYQGGAYHVRLSEPVVGLTMATTRKGWMDVQTFDVIIVEVGHAYITETLIFPADELGNPLSFVDIVGIRAYDHQAALAALGFEVTG